MRPKRAPAVCLTCVANITPTSPPPPPPPPPPRLTATNDDVPKKCARLRPQTKMDKRGLAYRATQKTNLLQSLYR